MQLRRAAAIALNVMAVAFRVLGIVFGALTVLLCFPSMAQRLNIAGFVLDLSHALPDIIEGYGLVTSPFGGVFRLDFALAMIGLLVLDYACQRIAYTLQTRL